MKWIRFEGVDVSWCDTYSLIVIIITPMIQLSLDYKDGTMKFKEVCSGLMT